MKDDIAKGIARAKELLASRHATMATVNQDGSPHNTPFRLLYDTNLKNIYWGSHPESLHSMNVIRTGQIFVVIYDVMKRGGLYLRAEGGHILSGEELRTALDVHNSFRLIEGSGPLLLDYYTGKSPQRMWSAKITNFWVNSTERDENGHVVKDGRHEIIAKHLLD